MHTRKLFVTKESTFDQGIVAVPIRGDKCVKVIRPHLTADQRGSQTRFYFEDSRVEIKLLRLI